VRGEGGLREEREGKRWDGKEVKGVEGNSMCICKFSFE